MCSQDQAIFKPRLFHICCMTKFMGVWCGHVLLRVTTVMMRVNEVVTFVPGTDSLRTHVPFYTNHHCFDVHVMYRHTNMSARHIWTVIGRSGRNCFRPSLTQHSFQNFLLQQILPRIQPLNSYKTFVWSPPVGTISS